jgi:membrane-associated phospholipid phosphatase
MKHLRIGIIGLTLSLGAALGAESFPFSLDPLDDGLMLGGGLALYGGSLYLQSLKPAPSAADINPASIPFFDRAYPSNPSNTVVSVGDDLSIAMAALPLILLPGRTGGEIFTLGVMYAESLELAYDVDSLLKSVIVRYRPYAYSMSTPADFSNPYISASFPSSNTSLAFAAAVFMGYAFDELNPDSSMKVFVWASGLGLATAVSTLLVAGANHFVSDVVAGAAIGAASAYLVPFLHERIRAIKTRAGSAVSSIRIEPSPGGIAARLTFAP